MKHMKKEGGLGFRDIEKFTDALLSKQAWRILQNPNSLVARILRGWYFSLSYILRASRGTQPSFGWQSILHGKDLLKTGLRFTVGSGDLIQTWIDPWLSTHPPRAPRPLTRHQATVFLVKDLILPNKVGWNERPIRSPGRCSSHQHKDYLGWHYTENGIYTVKYWLATHIPDNDLLHIPPHGDPQIKSEIWKSHTVPKLKHFLWRMLSRALPTGEELEKRHISFDGFCRRCVSVMETTEHLFFNCPHVTQIWRSSNLPIPRLTNSLVTVEEKLKAMFNFHKHRGIYDSLAHLPFWILWKIWKSRNYLVFQRKTRNWQCELREAR